jgi:hypothetical protein
VNPHARVSWANESDVGPVRELEEKALKIML